MSFLGIRSKWRSKQKPTGNTNTGNKRAPWTSLQTPASALSTESFESPFVVEISSGTSSNLPQPGSSPRVNLELSNEPLFPNDIFTAAAANSTVRSSQNAISSSARIDPNYQWNPYVLYPGRQPQHDFVIVAGGDGTDNDDPNAWVDEPTPEQRKPETHSATRRHHKPAPEPIVIPTAGGSHPSKRSSRRTSRGNRLGRTTSATAPPSASVDALRAAEATSPDTRDDNASVISGITLPGALIGGSFNLPSEHGRHDGRLSRRVTRTDSATLPHSDNPFLYSPHSTLPSAQDGPVPPVPPVLIPGGVGAGGSSRRITDLHQHPRIGDSINAMSEHRHLRTDAQPPPLHTPPIADIHDASGKMQSPTGPHPSHRISRISEASTPSLVSPASPNHSMGGNDRDNRDTASVSSGNASTASVRLSHAGSQLYRKLSNASLTKPLRPTSRSVHSLLLHPDKFHSTKATSTTSLPTATAEEDSEFSDSFPSGAFPSGALVSGSVDISRFDAFPESARLPSAFTGLSPDEVVPVTPAPFTPDGQLGSSRSSTSPFTSEAASATQPHKTSSSQRQAFPDTPHSMDFSISKHSRHPSIGSALSSAGASRSSSLSRMPSSAASRGRRQNTSVRKLAPRTVSSKSGGLVSARNSVARRRRSRTRSTSRAAVRAMPQTPPVVYMPTGMLYMPIGMHTPSVVHTPNPPRTPEPSHTLDPTQIRSNTSEDNDERHGRVTPPTGSSSKNTPNTENTTADVVVAQYGEAEDEPRGRPPPAPSPRLISKVPPAPSNLPPRPPSLQPSSNSQSPRLLPVPSIPSHPQGQLQNRPRSRTGGSGQGIAAVSHQSNVLNHGEGLPTPPAEVTVLFGNDPTTLESEKRSTQTVVQSAASATEKAAKLAPPPLALQERQQQVQAVTQKRLSPPMPTPPQDDVNVYAKGVEIKAAEPTGEMAIPPSPDNTPKPSRLQPPPPYEKESPSYDQRQGVESDHRPSVSQMQRSVNDQVQRASQPTHDSFLRQHHSPAHMQERPPKSREFSRGQVGTINEDASVTPPRCSTPDQPSQPSSASTTTPTPKSGRRLTQVRPPGPIGPRPSASGGRSRNASVSNPRMSSDLLGASSALSSPNRPGSRRPSDAAAGASPRPGPRFQEAPVSFKPYTLEVAQWKFSSAELQGIVSSAIRQSAEPGKIRVLPLDVLERDLPAELARLEVYQQELKVKYKLQVRKRNALMTAASTQSSASNGSVSVQTLRAKLDDLRAVTEGLDELADALFVARDQAAQLQRLMDMHAGSALAIALRKLNASFLKRTKEAQDLSERCAALEQERDEAWAQAQRVATEVDALNEALQGGSIVSIPESTYSTSSRRSSQIMASRKSSVRVSNAGLRPASLSKSRRGSYLITSPNRLSSMSASRMSTTSRSSVYSASSYSSNVRIMAAPNMHRSSTTEFVPPSHSGHSSSIATPSSTGTGMENAQALRDVMAMLGIDKGELDTPFRRRASMSSVVSPMTPGSRSPMFPPVSASRSSFGAVALHRSRSVSMMNILQQTSEQEVERQAMLATLGTGLIGA